LEKVYSQPEYYEIAFSFRDLGHEVATLAELARRHSTIPVTHVLEIACGNSPHLAELAKHGFTYTGIDRNEVMLGAARQRAGSLGVDARLVRADLANFDLPERVDFAFVLLGSLYVTSNEELRSHFDAMGRALRPGGLYVLDWCVDFIPAIDIWDTWDAERGGVRVKASYKSVSVNRAQQVYRETLTLEVDDHGRQMTFMEVALKRAIYPQEFLLFLDERPDFEFVGWWDDWDLEQPIDNAQTVTRPVIAVRRTATGSGPRPVS